MVRLWTECGLVVPWNDSHKDIRRKLEIHPELFLVALHDHQLVGAVMAGYDGHRGWIYYFGVHPEYRRAGIGRHLQTTRSRKRVLHINK